MKDVFTETTNMNLSTFACNELDAELHNNTSSKESSKKNQNVTEDRKPGLEKIELGDHEKFKELQEMITNLQNRNFQLSNLLEEEERRTVLLNGIILMSFNFSGTRSASGLYSTIPRRKKRTTKKP